MPWPQRLNDNKGHIVPNGSDDVKCLMMMADYTQLFVKPGTHWPVTNAPGFLEFLLSANVCMYVCVCVCVSALEAVNNYWHDIDPI